MFKIFGKLLNCAQLYGKIGDLDPPSSPEIAKQLNILNFLDIQEYGIKLCRGTQGRFSHSRLIAGIRIFSRT